MPKKLTDFVAARSTDHTAAIRAFLRQLGSQYVDQRELCRATGVSYQDLGRYRDAFKQHLVPTRNAAGRPAFLWAGTPNLAKQMREVSNGRV